MLLSWVNWLDEPGVGISASSAAGGLTPHRLADPRLVNRWRTLGAAGEALTVDLGAEREVSVVALAQPHDAGGVDARGRARGALQPADLVRHRLDSAASPALLNRVLWSERFEVAPWGVFSGATVSPDAGGLSPMGLPGAERLTFPAGSGEVGQLLAIPAAETGPWHLSIWLRSAGAAQALLRLNFGGDFSRFADLRVTFASGIVEEMPGRPLAMTAGTLLSEDWGNGWRRVGFAAPNGTGRTFLVFAVLGQGAGGAVDAWGAQLVPGTSPLGYRATEGAPAGDGPGVGRAFLGPAEAGGWQPGYGVHVRALAAPVQARFWRADFWGAGQGFIDLGRAWTGPAWRPSRNGARTGGINADWRWEYRDGSEVTRNPRSGIEFVDAGPRQRAASFGLRLTSDEDAAAVREMTRVAGQGGQVLFVPRLSAGQPALGQEAMIGRLERLDPLAQPFFRVFDAAFTVRATL